MRRYVIINEPCEISINEFKKYGNIIDAHMANGMRNGTYSIVEVFDTLEEAMVKLKEYKCTYRITSGFANVKFYIANLIYIVEQEYNNDYEEWKNTDEYDFAEIQEG